MTKRPSKPNVSEGLYHQHFILQVGRSLRSQFNGKLGFSSVGSVSVQHAFIDGLIHDADGAKITSVNGLFIALCQSAVKLLDCGLDAGHNHAIAKVFLLCNANALNSGLMVCQVIHLPNNFTTQSKILDARLKQTAL